MLTSLPCDDEIDRDTTESLLAFAGTRVAARITYEEGLHGPRSG